jgi:SAM-dependent methyltransferase
MWEQRFGGADYHYGTAPADFLLRHAGLIPPGSDVLSVAEGEGRNAAFLAGLGHRVVAFDASPTGLMKARALAERGEVRVEFHLSQLEDWDWREAAHDAVVAIFAQFAPPPLRARLFAGVARTLRPGGLALIHGFAPRQVHLASGGPREEAHLYTLPMLEAAFPGWEVLVAVGGDRVLREGTGHVGPAALVDFVARKPGGAGGDAG